MDKKLYFKITNKTECHNRFQYKDGLNVLNMPFQEKGECVSGGLYFTDAQHIMLYLDYGIYLREITLPKEDPEFKMVEDPSGGKWRANKIILGKRYDLKNLSTFKYLEEIGANLRANNDHPIIWASKKGCIEIVHFLIQKGCNVRAQQDLALSLASRGGHLDIVRLLIENGADVKINGGNAMNWACMKGHIDIVKYLVDCGVNVNSRYWNSFIETASRYGHLDVVNFLIECGANVTAGQNGAIKMAAGEFHFKVMEVLIKNGADPKAGYEHALGMLILNNCYDDVVEFLGKIIEKQKI